MTARIITESDAEFVPLHGLDRVRVQLSVTPLPTVFMFALGAFPGRPEAAGLGPPEWRSAVRAALGRHDLQALAPLADPKTTAWPQRLAGVRTPGVTGFERALDAVVSAEPTDFVAALGEEQPDVWAPARRDPQAWLRGYAAALRRVWSVVEPLWERSSGRLEREVERVGAAVALGSVAEGVGGDHPLGSAAGPRTERTVADRFVITPLVVEQAYAGWVDESGALAGIAYPVPAAWRAFEDGRPLPAPLEALLGDQRARILVRLERPATAGDIAATMYASPGAASYQLRTLESAGLVTRSRRGRQVAVERTPRGAQLVALYAE